MAKNEMDSVPAQSQAQRHANAAKEPIKQSAATDACAASTVENTPMAWLQLMRQAPNPTNAAVTAAPRSQPCPLRSGLEALTRAFSRHGNDTRNEPVAMIRRCVRRVLQEQPPRADLVVA